MPRALVTAALFGMALVGVTAAVLIAAKIHAVGQAAPGSATLRVGSIGVAK